MNNRIQEAFGTLSAPERLKRQTRAVLRRKTFDYGRNVLQRRQFHGRIAACALSLALVLTGGSLWFLPATSIALEVNPSIELKVNALDRVISLEGKNADGIELVKELDVAGMTYDNAMQRILLSQGMEPYLER